MSTSSTARTQWQGPLSSGSGTTELATSGVATFDVAWGKREKAGAGTTNPEELIAAALATCYSMALAHALEENGTPPEAIDTEVGVDFTAGTGITGATIAVTATVGGLAEDEFQRFAEDTKVNCPVSQALSGVEKSLKATLKG